MIDDAARAWLFDAFAWALRTLDCDEFYESAVLVLPTDAYFPEQVDNAEDAARMIFDRVADYAGFGEGSENIELIAEVPEPDPLAGHERTSSEAEFLAEWVPIEETRSFALAYNATLPSKPDIFVAVVAWHVAQFFMDADSIPGGEAYHTHAVDVVAIFFGFGVFLANAADRFEQFSDGTMAGWRISRIGTLSQTEMLYVLAMFIVLKGIDTDTVLPHLERKLRKPLLACIEDVNARPDELGRLRSVGAPSPVPEGSLS